MLEEVRASTRCLLAEELRRSGREPGKFERTTKTHTYHAEIVITSDPSGVSAKRIHQTPLPVVFCSIAVEMHGAR